MFHSPVMHRRRPHIIDRKCESPLGSSLFSYLVDDRRLLIEIGSVNTQNPPTV